MPGNLPIRNLNIIVMGENGSGRTDLIRAFVHKEPRSLPNPTNHLINLHDHAYTLSLYKTDFNNYKNLFTVKESVRNNGVMIVCNLTKENSLDNVENQIKKLRNDGFHNIILVGANVENSRHVAVLSKMCELANKTGCNYGYVDSSEEKFAKDLFVNFAKEISKRMQKRSALYRYKFDEVASNWSTLIAVGGIATLGVGLIPLAILYKLHKPTIRFLVTTEKEEKEVKDNRALWRGDRPKPPRDPNKPNKEIQFPAMGSGLAALFDLKKELKRAKQKKDIPDESFRCYLVDKEQYRRFRLFTHPVDPKKVTQEMMDKSKEKSKKLIGKLLRMGG